MEQRIRKEPLGKYSIYVTDEHRFGTDAVLLAHFSAPKHKEKVMDLCSGCGIIALLIKKDFSPKSVTALEIQENAKELFMISQSENKTNIEFITADLKNIDSLPDKGKFDVVVCNPPYFKDGAGIKSKSKSDCLARHETACSIEDVCLAAKTLLKFSGRLCICQRPERLTDIFEAMRKNGIEPKKLRTVSKCSGEKPWLVLVDGKLGGKPNIEILPPLFVEDENGNFSKEMIEIYGDYKEAYL